MYAGIVLALIFGLLHPEEAASPDRSKAPSPRVPAGSFMVDDDYPKEALRLKQEGSTQVLLPISKRGSALGCKVLDSSGSPSLDEATCTMLRKLKYNPARDADGRTVSGDFITRLQWKLSER
ncbi:energy transducer TonB [Sphingomonas xinjiangensis]|uniref:energy transducer TonB n=1 Tax=Sphingomonas xinjiangensis TaxID=643568 RepID=UPI001C841D01